jgi:spore germination protein GerM
MKRLMAVFAVAVLLAACGNKAQSGGQVSTGPTPATTGSDGPTTTPPTTEPTQEPTDSPTTSPEPTDSPEPETVTLEVWFDDESGQRLARVFRTLPATQAVGSAALRALLEGPSDDEVADGVGTQIPPGTDLIGLAIADSVATVNLTKDYFSGGSAVSEWTRLGQVVWTISQFATVDGVEISLDGKPIRTFDIDGNFLDRPWTREDFEFIAPAIVVDTPAPGDTVSSPIEVSGTADVFEATVSLRLLDENGDQIAEGFTTATCGTGCRGTFETTLAYEVDHDQTGTLEVFEASAKDGSPTNVVSIPVTLTA